MMRIDMLDGSTWTSCSDLISATMVQSANSIGSLTIDAAPTSACIGFAGMNTLVRVYDDETESYPFYGRIIDKAPKMDSSGAYHTQYLAEDCIAFLKDTTVQFTSDKKWFDDSNSSIVVEVNEDDGTREVNPQDFITILLNQHNSTIGDASGDKWKKFKLGTYDQFIDDVVSVSSDIETSAYDMLCMFAEETGAEFRARYNGTDLYLDVSLSLGSTLACSIEVGDNMEKSDYTDSMADVVTRTFPFGEKYAKLDKTVCTATSVSGRLKGSKWESTSSACMCRYNVEDAIKLSIVIGNRNKDYAMVFFTEDTIANIKDSDGKVSVLKKYTPSKTTSDNRTVCYPVPDKAKYCYVFGTAASGTKCTKYSYKLSSYGNEIGKDYYVDLGFWKQFITQTYMDKYLTKYGLTMGYVTDNSSDKLYFLQKNTDKYGVVEGSIIKDNLLKVEKITDSDKAVFSLSDLVSGSTKKSSNATKKAKRFFRWACRMASRAAKPSYNVTVGAYDLAQAGYDYTVIKLFDKWNVKNSLIGLDVNAEVVRIKRDVLKPWDVQVELGSKVTRSSGAGGGASGSLDLGSAPTATGDDGNDAGDTAETTAAADALAADAKAEASEAIEHASKAKQYADEATGLAGKAYDTVFPITSDMRKLIEEGFDAADMSTAVETEMSYTYSGATALAKVKADYSFHESKSAAAWKSEYTATVDAWADESQKAEIEAARATLNAAYSSYKTALGEEIAAEEDYACSLVDLAAAQAILAKKQESGTTEEVAAAQELVDAAQVAIYGEGGTAENPTEGGSLYALNQAKDALATAEAEVTLAENGIHTKYTSVIEQKADKVAACVTKTDMDGAISEAKVEITADAVRSAVSKVDAKGYVTETGMTQTIDSFDWVIKSKGLNTYMSFTGDDGKGNLTIGGLSSSVCLGGQSSTVSMVDGRVEISSSVNSKGTYTTDITNKKANQNTYSYVSLVNGTNYAEACLYSKYRTAGGSVKYVGIDAYFNGSTPGVSIDAASGDVEVTAEGGMTLNDKSIVTGVLSGSELTLYLN